MKYLYTYGQFNSEIYRRQITKETDSNIWIKQSDTCEVKISKKTMQTGSGYESTKYYHETPELKSKYEKCYKYRLYLRKLDELKNCKNDEIIDLILQISLTK